MIGESGSDLLDFNQGVGQSALGIGFEHLLNDRDGEISLDRGLGGHPNVDLDIDLRCSGRQLLGRTTTEETGDGTSGTFGCVLSGFGGLLELRPARRRLL